MSIPDQVGTAFPFVVPDMHQISRSTVKLDESFTDCIIVGAGVSGIYLACKIARECPSRTIRIIERRQTIGGTWDLFRYPGVRSDSDMNTFGFDFKPWKGSKILADGDSIRCYLDEATNECRIKDKIVYQRKVESASWSTPDALWTFETKDESNGKSYMYRSRFFFSCAGYYDFDQPYDAGFEGKDQFLGTIVQPQFWPKNLNYSGKKVVIIGSGATAVTLVPSMAKLAGHVTMLQRSPSYIVPLPSIDIMGSILYRLLPENFVFNLNRTLFCYYQYKLINWSKSNPEFVRALIAKLTQFLLRGTSISMKHFTPSYDPWSQRLCVVPDGDLFTALRSGKASIETDKIKRFTRDGIALESGRALPADIIVTATGLKIQVMGGMKVLVDGHVLDASKKSLYKGILVAGVPNAAIFIGYTYVTWTLKTTLVSSYICRMLNFLDEQQFKMFCAYSDKNFDYRTAAPIFGNLSSGYLRRDSSLVPRQGTDPLWWTEERDYYQDKDRLLNRSLLDDYLHFDGKVFFGKSKIAAASQNSNLFTGNSSLRIIASVLIFAIFCMYLK